MELPQDVLMSIFATLEVPDLVRAGSVCSSWRSAYTSICSLGHCKPQQTPCLLYTFDSDGTKSTGLYSLVEKKAYVLPLQDLPNRHIIGSCYGWIVTADERSELHLVNPITGEQIALPSVTTIKQVKPIYDDDVAAAKRYKYLWHTGEVTVSDSSSILYYKAFVSCDPSMGGGYTVVLIHNPYCQLSFARAGDDKWTWLPPYSDYEDCFFKDGLLYAATLLGETHMFDLTDPKVAPKIVMGKVKDFLYENIYIVEASCGNLLQIWRSNDLPKGDAPEGDEDDDDHSFDPESEFDSQSYVHDTNTIKVHKVSLTEGKIVEISSLDENLLFLGHGQTLCLHAEEYLQLKANHVYFTDNNELYLFEYKDNHRDIGVLDLENFRREEIVSPQIWSNWPPPIWLIPNPRRMKLASH
uniref:F-box domain-containing protein n=1 Tax=Oryza nivara TaxID=4536 RepID=A0A0E0J3L3_ORYNI